MPRRADPTALDPREAEEVRELVRAVKALTGRTSDDLAYKLGWDVRSVTNALSASRPLLAERAAALLREVAPKRGHSKASGMMLEFYHRQRVTHGWLERYRDSLQAPSAFVPPFAIDRLAAFLTDRLFEQGLVRPKTSAGRAAFESALRRIINRAAPKMAASWRSEAATAMHRYVGEVEAGRIKWESMLGDLVVSKDDDGDIKSIGIKPVSALKLKPRHFASELIALLVDIAFQHKKEGR